MATYQNRKNRFNDQLLHFADYKNIYLMRKFISQWGKIVPRYYSGLSLQAQKRVSGAVKRARFMALVPFVRDVQF